MSKQEIEKAKQEIVERFGKFFASFRRLKYSEKQERGSEKSVVKWEKMN